MNIIRLATPDEVESIRLVSDLVPNASVLAYEKDYGPADLAVLKQLSVLDPLVPSEGTDLRRKAMFIWSIENAMRIMGIASYHFAVPADDTAWQKVVENWGAERLSPAPVYNYTKYLQAKPEKSPVKDSSNGNDTNLD